MRRLKTLVSALVVAMVIVTCADYASFAATGHAFILGKINKANRITTLNRTTSGPALKLHTTSSGASPMKVNGHGKVYNLNADTVDGVDSTALRTGTYVFTKNVSSVSNVDMTISLPAGSYVLGYSLYTDGGGTDGSMGGCYFYRTAGSTTTYFGEVRTPTLTGDQSGFSGIGETTVGSGVTLGLYCYMPAAFSTYSTEPLQITATRTAVLGSSTLARLGAGSRVAPKHN